MANTINSIKEAAGILAKTAAQTLNDNMVFCSTIDKAEESDFDGKNGYKAGDTIYTSIPPRYIPTEDNLDITSSIQDGVEGKVPLVADVTSTVAMEFSSLELATDIGIKSVAKRFVIPAAESIAQNVESRFIEKSTDAVYQSSGTAGSNSFTVADVLAGKTNLARSLCPRGNRHFLLNSASGASAVDARKGLFQSSTEIDKQYKEGEIGMADGFTWYENELINLHTNGNDVTGVTKDAISVEGDSTMPLQGFTTTTGTIKKGQIFTVANVYKVHPITKVSTGVLQQFVCTADATADGSGDISVAISPSIYAGSDGLQNVDSLPQDNAVITFVGAASTAYAQPLQYHSSAFKMVSLPLEMPTNAEFAEQVTVDGITVAIVRDFDVLKRRMITRLDFLGGLSAVRPEWANRVTA